MWICEYVPKCENPENLVPKHGVHMHLHHLHINMHNYFVFIHIQNVFGHAKTLLMKNCVQHINIFHIKRDQQKHDKVPATIICAVEMCQCLGDFL